jgi:hypothetical protein
MTSILKVDTIQDQAGNNIINESSDTITIGASGDTVTTSANVGIKTTTPATELDISSGAITAGTKRYITLTSLNASSSEIGYADIGVTFNQNTASNESGGMNFRCFHDGTMRDRYIFGAGAGDTHAWYTGAGTERMRIQSDGKVLIGTITHSISSTQSGEIKSSGATGFAMVNTTAANNPLSVLNEGTSGTRRLIQFLEGVGGGTVRGFISTDGSTVAYNTTSDYRLKENVTYDFDAITRLKQLKPARFNFITEPDKTVDGFLAHEVSDIIPEATTGTKDATETKEKVVVNIHGKIIDENIEQADWEAGKIPNEEGTSKYPVDSTWEASKVIPVYQAIDQAKLTPILTKALQEAIARIEQLEARITTLENN